MSLLFGSRTPIMSGTISRGLYDKLGNVRTLYCNIERRSDPCVLYSAEMVIGRTI